MFELDFTFQQHVTFLFPFTWQLAPSSGLVKK